MLRTLQTFGASITQADINGRTALHNAVVAAKDPPTVPAYLLSNGADAAVADNQGMLPLHVACDAGAGLATVRLLLRDGAAATAVDARCSVGRTAVHYAAQKGDVDVLKVRASVVGRAVWEVASASAVVSPEVRQ